MTSDPRIVPTEMDEELAILQTTIFVRRRLDGFEIPNSIRAMVDGLIAMILRDGQQKEIRDPDRSTQRPAGWR